MITKIWKTSDTRRISKKKSLKKPYVLLVTYLVSFIFFRFPFQLLHRHIEGFWQTFQDQFLCVVDCPRLIAHDCGSGYSGCVKKCMETIIVSWTQFCRNLKIVIFMKKWGIAKQVNFYLSAFPWFLKAFQSVYPFPYILCYNVLCDFVSLIFTLISICNHEGNDIIWCNE